MGDQVIVWTLGDRVKRKGTKGEATWRIVSISQNLIGLSGPGPCRSYRTVTHEEMDSEWEKVE